MRKRTVRLWRHPRRDTVVEGVHVLLVVRANAQDDLVGADTSSDVQGGLMELVNVQQPLAPTVDAGLRRLAQGRRGTGSVTAAAVAAELLRDAAAVVTDVLAGGDSELELDRSLPPLLV